MSTPTSMSTSFSTMIQHLRDLRSPASTQRLSLGCPHLDALLGGGIPVGCLTEVAGEATAGKTQLCLRLLLNAQLPEDKGGLDGCALWLCSEKGDPPVRRLAQMASTATTPPSSPSLCPSTDNVYVEKGIATPQGLVEILDRMEPLMVENGTTTGKKKKKRVRLVVVDSIAALFRDAAAATDDGSTENATISNSRTVYAARASALFAVAVRLKRLADDHSLAVVVVNQVTDVVGGAVDDEGNNSNAAVAALAPPLRQRQQQPPPTHTAGLRLVSSGREVAPALGLAWASCVGVRLFLSRAAPVGSSFFVGGETGGGTATTATRCLQVVFAPYLPPSYCLATVDARGLVGVVEGEAEGQKEEEENAAERRRRAPLQQSRASAVDVVCSGVFEDGG